MFDTCKWSPELHTDFERRLNRKNKPHIFILHPNTEIDFKTMSKNSKEWKRSLKRKYIGKMECRDLLTGETGHRQSIRFISSEYVIPSIKFPTPTQIFHKRKKRKRALTGRR